MIKYPTLKFSLIGLPSLASAPTVAINSWRTLSTVSESVQHTEAIEEILSGWILFMNNSLTSARSNLLKRPTAFSVF